MTVKITPTRAAAINTEFRESLGEKVPYQGRSKSRYRMLEAMRDEGIMYGRESTLHLPDGQPRKPKELQRGPTPTGLRAYLDQGLGGEDRERMEARIPELKRIEAQYESAMQAYTEDQRAKREERAAQRRAIKVAAFREFFTAEGIDLGARDDDAMLDLVESIVSKEMAL